jgi:winged helix DNA-binding protein
MGAIARIDRDQVIAFRLAGHHLDRRLPPGSLVVAAAACGVQDTPPGAAALALCARVAELAPADIDRALAEDRTLLVVWSLRLAPCLVPTADAAVFTAGVLPRDEASLRVAMPGPAATLGRAGATLTEAVERTVAAARDVLDGRALTKGELSGEVSSRLRDELTPWCEPCQAHHVPETVFRALGPHGVACLAPRTGNKATLVRTDQWLGAARPAGGDPELARAELVRRYLRCYGPSTPKQLAQWVGIGPADARGAWRLVEPELAEVEVDGGRAWLLEADSARLTAPPAAAGARLLPPSDPFLALRDRDTLVPVRAQHRRVWRPIGNPGVVLLDGRVAGIWRPRKQGRRLTLTVELFAPLPRPARDAIQAEAERAAPFRAATTAEVAFAG